MELQNDASPAPDPKVRDFYRSALTLLDSASLKYVVGGGYAMACYTGVVRDTKDLDVFVKPEDRDPVLRLFSRAGYKTEITWPHFLAKVLTDGAFVDVLYSSANGLSPVDDLFFEHATSASVLGCASKLCPVEEMIWSKAFVQDRERYDGADVAHLIRAWGSRMDWRRLRERFRGHEPVLLAHLVLFNYIYPSDGPCVPAWLLDELWSAARAQPAASPHVCRGTFLSHDQYFHDVKQLGYADARLRPLGPLTAEQIASISPT